MSYPVAGIVYSLIAFVVLMMAVLTNRKRIREQRITWKTLAMLALFWAAIAIIAIVFHLP